MSNTVFKCVTGSIVISCLAFGAAPAFGGASILSVGGNVSPTPIFVDAPGPDSGEWALPDATFSAGSVNQNGTSLSWDIAPSSPFATLNWSGSQLVDDLSTGGAAEGLFAAGGTLSISGELWDLGADSEIGGVGPDADTLIHNGLLVAGTVSEFHVEEFYGTTNILRPKQDTRITFHPTGGFLTSSSPMQLAGDYYLSFLISQAQQNGGPMTDFDHDVITVSAFQVTLTQIVPEPATAGLMFVGFSLLALRRGRRA